MDEATESGVLLDRDPDEPRAAANGRRDPRDLAAARGLEFVELDMFPISGAAAVLLPEALCKRHLIIPIGERDDRLVVAMADPGNVFALDDVRTITGREIEVVVAAAEEIELTIQKYAGMRRQADLLAEVGDEIGGTEQDLDDVSVSVDDAPIIKLVQAMMMQATSSRASDIHVEPREDGVRVRFRVDGVLHEIMQVPKAMQNGLISRLKVMADLDIAERRVPQDGRISIRVGTKAYDLRVASLPTVWGEKVTARILQKSDAVLALSDLGFRGDAYLRYEKAFRKPYGTILVTGPTGSGKSTTLYATLNILNDTERNIFTVEDPVEYRIPGINQIQVNPRAKLTFASALRSILRADPDVILIGEIRDRETAQIAVEAALTGHLVLSTLHTNDAPSAITRLVEMGVETFLVASSLDAVVAQRLARKLCDRCKEPYAPEPQELLEAGFTEDEIGSITQLFRPVGCRGCTNTGYHGRLALYEVMLMSEKIERLTVDRASSEDIRALAAAEGMVGLREDGLKKAVEGITSLAEIARVVK
ncbi:MAG: GspE/PulE family protein [Actinomycetota bacterium]